MLRSIDKVTTEYQHPWIARNCGVYKYLLRRSVYTTIRSNKTLSDHTLKSQ